MKRLLVLTIAAMAVTALGRSLEIVGFSDDGRHLAYTVSGVYEGSGFPYCRLVLLSSPDDSIIARHEAVDPEHQLDTGVLRDQLLEELREVLDSYGIQEGNTGVFIEYPPIDSPAEAMIISFRPVDGVDGLSPGLYSLDLFQEVLDSSSVYYGMYPSTCSLYLTRAADCGSGELLNWEERPLLEDTVYRFELLPPIIHPEGIMVVFIECTVRGFEVPGTEVVPAAFNDLTMD